MCRPEAAPPCALSARCVCEYPFQKYPSGEGVQISWFVFQLGCGCSVTPREQLVDTSDLVIGDTSKGIGEPCLRIDAVKLGCFNQSVSNRG